MSDITLRLRAFFLAVLLAGSASVGTGAEPPGIQPFTEGSWTIAVIPDTQYYVRDPANAGIFTELTEWIVGNREERNIRLVLHLGDIVDRNDEAQWARAKESMRVLDGHLPYVLNVGNHDLGRNASDRSTMLNDTFKLSGNPENGRIFGGCFQEGHLENAWYEFRCGNRNYIIFALEFGPRREVVEWANEVAAKKPGHSFMLVTHEFIDQESSLFSDNGYGLHTTPKTKNSPHGYGIGREGNALCGEELWDAFVSRHSHFELVFNGHYKPFEKTAGNAGAVRHVRDLATAYRKDGYADGRVVHQMLFNGQWAPKGGDGWIRLLEFQPDGETVRVKTYSPYLERTTGDPARAWRSGEAWQFDLKLPPPPAG